jgi:hypothetical protein
MQFKTEFLRHYNSPAYTELLQEQFLRRSQHKDEPVTHYSFVIRNFYSMLGIQATESSIINRIISKLCPKYIKYFCNQNFATFTAFETYATAVDNAAMREKLYQPPQPPQECIEPSLAWNYTRSEGATPSPPPVRYGSRQQMFHQAQSSSNNNQANSGFSSQRYNSYRPQQELYTSNSSPGRGDYRGSSRERETTSPSRYSQQGERGNNNPRQQTLQRDDSRERRVSF